MLATSTVKIFSRSCTSQRTQLHTKTLTDNRVRTSIKERLDNHVIHHFGYPKQGAAHGYEPEFVMVRTLQRYPNNRVQENLYRLHARMAERFIGMSDDALDWLLGGARLTSLGGINTPDEFRRFLNTDPHTFTPAQLISQLEPILTSIGYRSRNVPVAEAPAVPETSAQKEMYQVVCDITDGQIVPPISTIYPDKTTSWINSIPDEMVSDDFVVCDQDDELSDDEDNLFSGKPDKRIPDACYKATGDDGQPTWMAEARAQDIYVRRHVSGTAPICMAAAVGLLSHSGQGVPFNSEQEAHDFFSVLFIPRYLRCDYHSIVETYTGISHFTAENVSCAFEGSSTVSTAMSPQEAEARAYEAMCRAACDEHSEFGVTPSQAMRDYQLLIGMKKEAPKGVSAQESISEQPLLTVDDSATVNNYDKLMSDMQREIVLHRIEASKRQCSVELSE